MILYFNVCCIVVASCIFTLSRDMVTQHVRGSHLSKAQGMILKPEDPRVTFEICRVIDTVSNDPWVQLRISNLIWHSTDRLWECCMS
jgi:hypothetical protein